MSRRDLYLPPGYVENQPENLGDDAHAGYWGNTAENRLRRARRYQDAVYHFAARIPLPPMAVVLDVGCGTGANLARHFAGLPVHTIGVDQADAIAMARSEHPGREWIAADLSEESVWESLGARRPDLVLCVDVIEHVEDPRLLLSRLHRLVHPNGRLVLSTPDRDRLEDQPQLGPPRNPHHVREWAFAEMAALLASEGFTVRSARHMLPRRFGCNVLDAKIVLWRALHLRAVPARRSCMVFELSAD